MSSAGFRGSFRARSASSIRRAKSFLSAARSGIGFKVEKSSGFDVSTLKLVGVIEGRQPLALIEAPSGLGYIVKPGDMLGNGRVTEITRSSVTFAVAPRAGQRDTSLTLRIVRE